MLRQWRQWRCPYFKNRREVTFGPKLERIKLVELKGPENEMPLVALKSHMKL
jgi:hypothetical protein